MTQRARTGLAALGTVLVVAGCGSSGGDDDSPSTPEVIEVKRIPDPCATPPRPQMADALGVPVQVSGSKVSRTKVWCEWSGRNDLLATVHLDTGAADATDYLQELSGGGQELESIDVDGAVAGWASMSDLEEFQVFYAAVELDGAVYAVEVVGTAGRVDPEAATRVVRAAMAGLS